MAARKPTVKKPAARPVARAEFDALAARVDRLYDVFKHQLAIDAELRDARPGEGA